MGSQERRAHDRVPVRLPVRLRAEGGEEFDGVVENLGSLGALVSTLDLDTTLDVGDRLALEITRDEAEGGGNLAAAGVVVRVEQEFTGAEIRRSFAVRFDHAVENSK